MTGDVPGDRDAPTESDAAELGLEHFVDVPDDDTLSLEELSHAYARLMQQGEDPYEPPGDDEPPPAVADDDPAATAYHVTPRAIVEAILFVGHPENEPISARQIADLMRGVGESEVDRDERSDE